MSSAARNWLNGELETVVLRRLDPRTPAPTLTPPPAPAYPFLTSMQYASGSSNGSAFGMVPRSNTSHGYAGPPLTDADVRYLERGEQ